MPFRVIDLRRPFDWYLLIRHLRTLGWIMLPGLVRWIASAVLAYTAAPAAVDAEVLQSCVLVGLLWACHDRLQRKCDPLEERSSCSSVLENREKVQAGR